MSSFALGSPQPGEECCGSMFNFCYFDEKRRTRVSCCSYCAFECDDNELVNDEKPHKVVESFER